MRNNTDKTGGSRLIAVHLRSFTTSMEERKRSYSFVVTHHHHYQPINVPNAGAQTFLMDYPQGERAITHRAVPVQIGECQRLQIQPGATA
jgi:hypothetical protein